MNLFKPNFIFQSLGNVCIYFTHLFWNLLTGKYNVQQSVLLCLKKDNFFNFYNQMHYWQ